MKREQLARILARREGVSQAAAQDQLDSLVYEILKKLKSGRPVKLPGVGKLVAPK